MVLLPLTNRSKDHGKKEHSFVCGWYWCSMFIPCSFSHRNTFPHSSGKFGLQKGKMAEDQALRVNVGEPYDEIRDP